MATCNRSVSPTCTSPFSAALRCAVGLRDRVPETEAPAIIIPTLGGWCMVPLDWFSTGQAISMRSRCCLLSVFPLARISKQPWGFNFSPRYPLIEGLLLSCNHGNGCRVVADPANFQHHVETTTGARGIAIPSANMRAEMAVANRGVSAVPVNCAVL